MLSFRRKIISTLFLLVVFVFLSNTLVYAQASDDCQSLPVGQDKVNCYQKKVNDLHSQANTLSSQIAVMDNQIALTEARIAANAKQILDLALDIDTADKKIDNLQKSLNTISQVLINRIRSTYQVGTIQPIQVLLSSNDASNFLTRLNYLKIAQEHDRKLIIETSAAKNDYSNQKNILEDKKAQIEALKKQQEEYQAQLDQEKKSKQALLAQTQGSESTYQSLLAEAKKQLASLAGFTAGAGVLNNQTVCDGDWCYYNQRDSQWASTLINGQSSGCDGPCTVLSVGCTITSVAMVASHMGHKDISPADIATSSSQNFQVGTALLAFSINVKGVAIVRHPTSTWGSAWPDSRINELLDNDLKNGPVVVGMTVPTGTHFVVIKGGSGGNYIMNDPYTENGKDISFTSHYSVSSIYEVSTVSM